MITKLTTENVDAYIASFPTDVQVMLQELRATIKKAAPKAEEVISYEMPAYKYKGMLVYFAAYKNHIGFYPTSSGIAAFKKELSVYKGAKGSVQFPLNKALPLSLISKIVKYRVNENQKKELSKLKPKQDFLSLLSAPARRALENKNILTLKKLATLSEEQLIKLHGFGPGSIPKLKTALKAAGLSFKIKP